jgi:serine/threonine protein kinase
VLILDKYQILEEVGRGGMGLVYRAQDVRLGRIVALKELLIDEAITGEERNNIVSRFQREAQTAASLSHLNIVTIYDAGAENNRHFIAMEFLKGKNLKDYIIENHQFTLEQILDIFIQTADGLDHAHTMKIIHRDIKPANIQLIQRNIVKITDFGLAKSENISSSLTQDGTMFGTLGYISPEQLTNTKSVDSRADIFSFGAMMYEIVTRKLPFEGNNIGASIYNIINKAPEPVRDISPEIPEELEKIIMKCLQKDPDLRFQNSAEIVNELNKLLDNTGKPNQIIISGNKTIEENLQNTTLINSVKTNPVPKPADTILVQPGEAIQEVNIEKLKKGQKILIDEQIGSRNFILGLNWEYANKGEFEIESCALLLSGNDKLEKEENFVFYNNLSSPDKSVKIDLSDNQIFRKIIEIDLNKIASDITRIKFIITLDKNNFPKATFNDINKLSVSVITALNKNFVYFPEDIENVETVILIEIYKRNSEWKLQASGEGYKSKLLDFLKLFASEKIEISED